MGLVGDLFLETFRGYITGEERRGEEESEEKEIGVGGKEDL